MNESVDVTLFELMNASTETQTNQLYHHSIGEVNRPTDRRILEIFFARISDSERTADGLSDPAIRIADLINREELSFLLIGFGCKDIFFNGLTDFVIEC